MQGYRRSRTTCNSFRRRRCRRCSVPGLVGAADAAALRGNHEAQVHPEPAVGGTSVRPHVSPRLHDGELDLHTRTHTQL